MIQYLISILKAILILFPKPTMIYDTPYVIPEDEFSNETLITITPNVEKKRITKKNAIIEFKNYLIKENIYFLKNKQGNPNMKYKVNKVQFERFKEQQQYIIIDELKETMKNDSEVNKVKKYDCVICMEEITNNVTILKCSHSFCVNCILTHSLTNNTCPLCRDKYFDKTPKPNMLLSQQINEIVYDGMNNVISERDDMTLVNFIQSKLKYGNYNDENFQEVINEINETLYDVANAVNDYYKN